jgi:hypothetical protein
MKKSLRLKDGSKPPIKRNDPAPEAKSNEEPVAPTFHFIPDPVPPDKKDRERQYHQPDQTPLWKILLEVGATLVASTVLVIYVFQLSEMKEANETSRHALKIARQQTIQDQRPWFAIEPKFPDKVEIGKPIEVTISVTNRGKTPAVKFVVRYVFEAPLRHIPPTFEHGNPIVWVPQLAKFGMVYPSDPAIVLRGQWFEPDRINAIAIPRRVTAADYDDFRHGRKYITVHGWIQYYDTFNVYHWQHFCAFTAYPEYSNIDFNTGVCADRNGMDSNTETAEK